MTLFKLFLDLWDNSPTNRMFFQVELELSVRLLFLGSYYCMSSFLATVTKGPTKATEGRKGLFGIRVQGCCPS